MKVWKIFRYSPVLLIVFIASCTTLSSVSNKNLSYQYDPGEAGFGAVQSVVYHSADSFSTVYVRVDRNILDRVAEAREEDSPKLTYILHNSYEAREILDSGTVVIPLEVMESEPGSWYRFDVNVPSKRGEKYVFQILVKDFPELHHVAFIDREWSFSQQDVLLTDLAGEPLFDNVIARDQSVRLSVRDANIEKLMVRSYHRSFEVALPPFAFQRREPFDFSPDSTFEVLLEAGISGPVQLDRPGIYHFQASKDSRWGKTLYRFHEAFPVVNQAKHMLPPLRYLTSSKEFQDMMENPDIKLAVDRFWLGQIGNVSRARVRIKDFYSRVELANVLFTSYQEGWKTDRGMIYIMYGAPRIVYRSGDLEKWVYGEAGNAMSLKFTFNRVENPFTLSDFSLNKSPVYKESWYNAVESWRR